MLDLLGRAGCVSIEAGVESITVEGRNLLDKGSRLIDRASSPRGSIHAKQHVPFVQANLLESGSDDPAEVERMAAAPRGSTASGRTSRCRCSRIRDRPGYTKRWGAADDRAWERALESYLPRASPFSDIQDARPRPLDELELDLSDVRH